MEYLQYDYAVIGGDMRQVYLAEVLAHHQNKICCFALPTLPDERRCSDAARVVTAASLFEACAQSRCIICPVPFSKNAASPPEKTAEQELAEECPADSPASSDSFILKQQEFVVDSPNTFSQNHMAPNHLSSFNTSTDLNHFATLNQTAFPEPLSLDALLDSLRPGQHLFGGCIPDHFAKEAVDSGITVTDFMQDETLTASNSIATAEGAICEAILRSRRTLHGSYCAVLGYGKCGKALAQYLSGMFCRLSVWSIDSTERSQAAMIAENTGNLGDFAKHAEEFDFIFNTIPAPVVTVDILRQMKDTAVIIDIASAPGGVDFNAAKRLGITAALCLGLPGKYAPFSSAQAQKRVIETALSDRIIPKSVKSQFKYKE